MEDISTLSPYDAGWVADDMDAFTEVPHYNESIL